MTRLSAIPLIAALLLIGCRGEDIPQDDPQGVRQVPTTYVAYGNAIDEVGPALAASDVVDDPRAFDGTEVRVEGEIVQVCRQFGCWLSLDNPAGEPLRIDVPRDGDGEYLWTVPTDLGRHFAIVEGTAHADTLSVDQLRHYAEDGGAPQEEIDAITEPRASAHIVATGLLIEEHELAPSDVDAEVNQEDDLDPVNEDGEQTE